jgi:hypothetical protein
LRYILHTNSFLIREVTCNRIKAISLAYLIFWPLTYLMTSLVYYRELGSVEEREIGNEILKQSYSLGIYCGESQIVKAQKV